MQDAAYPIVQWLDDVQSLKYSDYWNNEQEERQKPFWVLDGDFKSMERYLAEIRLVDQLEACVALVRERFSRDLRGTGCDLGAGNLWAVPHLLRFGRVRRIYCVEYSRHRLTKLGPAVLRHYGVPPESVVLALGDLHAVRLAKAMVDFVLLSAAFHHSDRPDRLLTEIRRVLKPDGVVLIIGEHIGDPTPASYARHAVKYLVAQLPHTAQMRLFGRHVAAERFIASFDDFLAGDERLGDHAYTRAQYASMFSAAGFHSACLRRRAWPTQAFVLVPSS